MIRLGQILFLLWMTVLALFHSGVMPKPAVEDTGRATAQWFDKKDFGIHQLILTGPAYERGLKAGVLTKGLLLAQEDALNEQLNAWLPYRWMRQLTVLTAIAWFQGIDQYFAPEPIAEMYGVSKSAPEKYNYLADPFTRQVAYHGLHEVGQMMVDRGFEGGMACTVIAVPRESNWVLGRNFDFEGGRIFDTEKIMKWVYPEKGHAYLSVIWAGMVGAVTGVNDQGVYVSINAAGSDDFKRVGTPTTLVLLRILEEASSTADAVRIFQESSVFISDIFVVSDRLGDLRVVEKTPARMAQYSLTKNSAVANHLLSPDFAHDRTNLWRQAELTSVARLERAKTLVEKISPKLNIDETTRAVLEILRDKGVDEHGRPLNLGHRRAIDALIATHSVIYDGVREIFYVSQGPALVGPYLGFDLRRSFEEKKPIRAGVLPRDPALSEVDFFRFKENTATIAHAHRMAQHHACGDALDVLGSLTGPGREQSEYYHALGDAQACAKAPLKARAAWTKALELTPAYPKQAETLERNLRQ